MDDNNKHRLSDDELTAEERDQQILEVARTLNASDAPPLEELLPGLQAVSDLDYWASLGNVGKVKIALNNGADVNGAAEMGYTALHAAAENGHLDIVKLLVEGGANVNAKLETGQTAADLASSYPEVIEYLRSSGAA